MVFSSLIFIFLFLPCVLLTYHLVPERHLRIRNAVLLFWSMLFYYFGEPKFIFFLLMSICVNYIIGRLMNEGNRKSLVTLAVIVNLSLLFYFKYANFFVRNLNSLLGSNIAMEKIIMPIGISFFTFQALSYIFDVYNDLSLKQNNIFNLALYISMFPQLVAGPIVRYEDITLQLKERSHNWDRFSYGISRFIQGLSKKVLLANTFAHIVDYVFALKGDVSFFTAWLGAIAYTGQIYYDFSGYSDMAIGLGEFFGFKFRENFNLPYTAVSITDFWRKWHISLSTWFRDYVYIPLGGNRRGFVRRLVNIFIVWILTGFWHGAEWNFVLWGLYYAILLVIEKNFLIKYIKKMPVIFQRCYAMFLVIIGWVIFRVDDLSHLNLYLKSMFSTSFSVDVHILFFVKQYGILLALGLLMILIGKEGFRKTTVYSSAIELLLFAWVIVKLLSSSYNPFIYFRF